MALTREKYRRVPDLYITGKELILRDGAVMWLQALNPLERDEAQHDAQVARARLVMALKSEHASDERMKVEAAFFTDGRDGAVERLVNVKLNEQLLETITSIRNDPEWKERMDILERGAELTSSFPEPSEAAVMAQVNDEYFAEIQKRQADEEAFLRQRYKAAPDAELIEEYVELYVERRGGEVARSEFDNTEIWFSARACEGVETSPGEWDHTACEGHQIRVYESKVEVHSLPEDLQTEIKEVISLVNMTVRDAKNSDRQGSSSDSSPLPSVPEESTPSTPVETPSEPLGSSLQPSATP